MARAVRAQAGSVSTLVLCLIVGFVLVPALVGGDHAEAKGCQPACIRLQVTTADAPTPASLPICWSNDTACPGKSEAGPFVAGELVRVRVLWTDDAGTVLPAEWPAGSAYAAYFWTIPGATDAGDPTRLGLFPTGDETPIVVPVLPDGNAYAGTVRFPEGGLWVGQARPTGGWPEAPWGTDPVPVRVTTPIGDRDRWYR